MSRKPGPKLPVGTVFGKWTMLEPPRIAKDKVLCRCECGHEYRIRYASLTDGVPVRCAGCAGDTKSAPPKVCIPESPGGMRLYGIWLSMKDRCCNKNSKPYKNYGGRGIKVCDEWINDYSAFRRWAFSNGYANHLSLDRHPNNDGDYEPSNCRWATQKQQCRNTRVTRTLTAFGETKSLPDWADDPRCAVSRQTLGNRIRAGVEPETAIATASRMSEDSRPPRGRKGIAWTKSIDARLERIEALLNIVLENWLTPQEISAQCDSEGGE